MDMPRQVKGIIDWADYERLCALPDEERRRLAAQAGCAYGTEDTPPVLPGLKRNLACDRPTIAHILDANGFKRAVAGDSLFNLVVNSLAAAAGSRPIRGCLFSGGNGTGKTTAALAAGRSNILLARNLANHAADCTTTGDWILDDAGEEHSMSEFGERYEPFGDFVLACYSLYKSGRWTVPPIITTNLKSDDRNKRYGSRIESRLREMFICVDFGLRDLRMRD